MPTTHTTSKTKSGLQDFASLTTLKGFIPRHIDTPYHDMKHYDGTTEDMRGISKATLNQCRNRPTKTNQCKCRVTVNENLLLGWELYKPRKLYVNTNQHSRSNSTDVLRRLLIDHMCKKNAHGKPTALMRLIDGMKKPPPKPKYEYGNCLQQRLSFDDHTMTYGFEGKVEYTPPEIDEVYLDAAKERKPLRRNPFVEIQLCPTSLYNLTDQPAGREYDYRGGTLLDPNTWKSFVAIPRTASSTD